MPYTVEEGKLKELVKTAVAEALEEHRELVRDAVAEAIEDLGLIRAIEEGARTETVTRDEVFGILENRR
jgi:hypothetical protein